MKPPAIARRLLGFTLSQDDRADVLLNLDELYERKYRRLGAWYATGWYWIQAFTFSIRIRAASTSRSYGSAKRTRPIDVLTQFVGDLRYGLRSLVRTPSYTMAASATLALGVGANALIFAFVHEAVLKPLPFPEADRLAWIWPEGNIALTLEQHTAIQPALSTVATVSAFAGRGFAITGGDIPDEVFGAAVSTDHFDVFGLRLPIGRGFYESDGLPGAEPVAVLSHELWQTTFAGDSAIIGRRIDLYTAAAIPMIPGAFTGEQHTVIGVTPPNYRPFGTATQVFTPLVLNQDDPAFANMGELYLIARLRDGSTVEHLQSELATFAKRSLLLEHASEDIATSSVVDLHTALVGGVRPGMFVTLGAVAVVLMIACANVMNLSLVRTQARRREIAMRRALGASQSRLVRQLMTESLVLSTIGVGLGFLIAWAALPFAQRTIPHTLGVGSTISVNGPLVLFGVMVLFITLLFCGLVPAVRYSGATNRERSLGRKAHTINAGLATAEIALALTMAYGAALLLVSFNRLTNTSLGFNPNNVVTVRVAPSEQRYHDPGVRRALFERVLDQTRDLPGVVEAGAIHFLPIADGGPSVFFLIDPSDPETRQSGSYRVVTAGYLETLQIAVLAGRTIGTGDTPGGAPVGLVNRSMVNQLWPDGNALGKTLYRTSGKEWFTVIGVVSDVRQSARGLPPRPEIYLPLAQSQWASSMTIVARTTDQRAQFGEEIASIVRQEDTNLPVTRTEWMQDIMTHSVADPRFYSILFSLFAALSLVLGGVGVYGVAAYVTNLRREQIGIKLALGATSDRVLRDELKRGAVHAGIGIAAGIAIVLVASGFLESLLFDLSPIQPLLLIAASTLLATIATLATLLPARRAARLSPMSTLRSD